MIKLSTIKWFTLFTLIYAFTPGCENIFAPGLNNGDSNTSLLLTEQRTAEDVLVNFSYAYNFKDSLVYADLLDSTFNFYYTNFDTDPVTQDHWGRDVDIKTTMGLFRYFETINLIWDTPVENRFTNEAKTEKRIWLEFKLTFDGGINIPTLSGEAIFTFKKKFLNPPDTTGIWKITSWIDRSKF